MNYIDLKDNSPMLTSPTKLEKKKKFILKNNQKKVGSAHE